MKINDYMKDLAEYDFAENFGDYDSGYICDIISEIADSSVSIYTQDQINFAMENDDMVEEVFAEGIAPDAENHFKNGGSLRDYNAAVGACAWYMQNERDMYDNMNECVLYAVCAALKADGVEDLTEDNISDLESLEFDNNDQLDNVIDEARELINPTDEDEDEE